MREAKIETASRSVSKSLAKLNMQLITENNAAENKIALKLT
jgi:hypothetical protein